MAGLTANGIGSGLDINGLVSQLMAVEQQPLTALATKEASYQAKLSAYGGLKSALSSLQTAADALKDSAKFSATKASVADTSLFSASSDSTAAAGTYSVEVTALAKVQRVATDATTAPAVAPGSLTITFGTYSTDGSGNVSFASDGSTPKTVTLAAGSTLAELRDAINGSGAGVTASVIDNGTAEQLVVTGKDTGAAKAFQISGSGGLAGFAYDASTGASSTLTGIQAAQDAKLTVDGITVTRATNTIDDVIDGVTLNLSKENPGSPTSLTVAADPSGATSAISAFVKAYNDLNTTLKNLTAYNADTKQASTLTGDSTARSIQTQLRSALGSAISGLTGASRLSDIGVSFQSDGTLAVDSSKLSAGLADPAKDVGTFFAGKDGVTGFAAMLSDRIDGYIDSDGLIAGRTDGINASIKSLDKQRDTLSERLTQTEARYRAQFTALDSLISSMTQTSNYLTQQLANLPKAASS